MSSPENSVHGFVPSRDARRKAGGTRPTRQSLQDAALDYLARQAASTRMLRSVLWRRVKRARLTFPDIDADEAEGWIADIIARLIARKILNDEEFSRLKAESLRRQGRSARRIRENLAQKGVKPPELGGAAEDLAAATLFAKKKRLGSWRQFGKAGDDAARRRKDFAAMARAGFSYEIAARALGTKMDEI